MSQELERVYTINLGKALISQSQHRAVRAVNMIKEFARHHMKVEDIKIEEDLTHQIWSKGIRNPPRKIRVRMSKTDEGFVLVSLYEEDEEKSTKKETPKIESKVGEPAKETKKEPAKETKKEPAKETKKEPAKETKKEPAKETKKEPAKETKKEPAKETKKEPAKETKKEPAKETKKEPAKETKKEPAKETKKEPAKETN